MAEPKIAVTAKIRQSTVEKVDALAEVFDITRSQVVAWATEQAVDVAYDKLEVYRELKTGMPPGAVPGAVA